MRKSLELSQSDSCLNRAKDDEMIFVLLGRDEAAPATIRAWVNERLKRKKNEMFDPQIQDALACAKRMESGRRRS